MARLVARDGYQSVTVARIVALAGVSRPTFYEYFTDREDCLLAALAPVRERLRQVLRAAARGEAPERCAANVVAALTDFARCHPGMARLAMSEPLTAGRRALDARDEMIAELALIIEKAYGEAPAGTLAPDLPSRVLLGAVSRMLASRLSCGDPVTAEFCGELTEWLASYELPLGEHRWRALRPHPPPPRSPFLPASPLRSPADPVPGAPRIPVVQAAEQQRLRIMFATAEVASRQGYDAATVAEIARQAGLETSAFYRLFAEKAEALRACDELLFGHLMALSAGAFVTGDSWPERVWEAARAFVQTLQDNSTLANLALVESHAAGARTARRLREIANAFTIFLEEGFRYEATRERPPEVCLEALATSVFELAYQLLRRGENVQMSGLLGHIVFIVLAPFLAADQANLFLEQRIPAGHERTRGRRRGQPPRRAATALSVLG